jgi:hypothetical protein
MKRFCLVLGMALLSCTMLDRAVGQFSPISPSATSAAESTDRPSPSPTVDVGGANTIYVAPFCTLLGEGDTQIEGYGGLFLLSWGWVAQTEQQVWDYIENAETKVTFNGDTVADGKRSDVFGRDDTYHVYWEKSLGVLPRGKYAMTFFEKFKEAIFDGWEYFGPGTENESIEDTCYLIVE